MDQHIDQMGRRAVQILLHQLAGTGQAPIQEVLPTKLLLRGSSGDARGPRQPAPRR